MLNKIGRLFTIKTRTEAWLVIYAIAVGAVERARHYMEIYPGTSGLILALACTGVEFVEPSEHVRNAIRDGFGPDVERLDSLMFGRRRVKAGPEIYREGDRFQYS